MATYNFLDKTGLGQVWAKIKALIVQSNWTEDDSTDPSYIQNRPAIRAGEGENGIIEGQIEDDPGVAECTLYLTGDAMATTFSYTTQDTLPSTGLTAYGYIRNGGTCHRIKSIDTTNNTITLDRYLSASALTNQEVSLYYKTANLAKGDYSHAEGKFTIASSQECHAEGLRTMAKSTASHAEGTNTIASGQSSHAEGQSSISYGVNSHAEGSGTLASGSASHTEGIQTIAGSGAQHVQGKYNIEDVSSVYADIVGNGSSSARSNAYTLDWSGNGWFAGKVSAGTIANPASVVNANDLATKAYVDANTGGSDVFWVNFTDDYESEEPRIVPDKTFAELTAAYASGKFIQATYYGRIYQMMNTLDGGYENYAYFKWTESYSSAGESNRGYFTVSTNYIEWSHGENSDDITFGYFNNDAPCMGYPPYPTGYTNGQILQYNSTSGKWEANSIPAQNGALSISSNVITLTNASGTTSSITLPIYNGGVQTV